MTWVIWAILAGNVFAFLLYGGDKFAAVRGRRRVSEMRLLLASTPGTALGAWCAVFAFRHKSSKASYLTKLAFVTVLQALVVGWALGSGHLV